MGARMTRPTPSWTHVTLQQARLLANTRQLGLLIPALITAQLIGEWGFGPSHPWAVLTLVGYQPLLLVAAGWAAIVWLREGPRFRTYHWSLPVRRDAHDLSRVAAGAVWLIAGLGALVLVGIARDLAGGRGDALAALGPGVWINFFTGPLTIYLVTSAVAVLTEHPVRALLLLVLGNLILTPLCSPGTPCGAIPGTHWVLSRFFRLGDATGGYIQPSVFHEHAVARLSPPIAIAGWLALATVLVILAARWRASR